MLAERCRCCGIAEEAQQAGGEDPGDLAGALLGGEIARGKRRKAAWEPPGWSCPQRPSLYDWCAVWRSRGTNPIPLTTRFEFEMTDNFARRWYSNQRKGA